MHVNVCDSMFAKNNNIRKQIIIKNELLHGFISYNTNAQMTSTELLSLGKYTSCITSDFVQLNMHAYFFFFFFFFLFFVFISAV